MIKRNQKTKMPAVAINGTTKESIMSARQYQVMVWTPSGQVPVIVMANHQQDAIALVRSMYASLLAEDARYSVQTYAKPL
jgi:hypothetical protein